MAAPPELERIDTGEQDFPVWSLTSGRLRIGFLPAIGGRLISLTWDGTELLWRNPERLDPELRFRTSPNRWPAETDQMTSWLNLGGSKTWPAPQSAWGGPPDPVLDGGRFELDSHLEGTTRVVRMISRPDARTGLQITRSFRLRAGAENFRQTTRFTNSSDRPVSWSIWEVCQIDTAAAASRPGAGVQVDLSAAGQVVDLGCYRGRPRIHRNSTGVFVPVQPVIAKWGFVGPCSTIGYGDGRSRLELGFSHLDDADYPDGGASAELWMQSPADAPVDALGGWLPEAHLVELEVLSPLYRLEPGQSAELGLEWRPGAMTT